MSLVKLLKSTRRQQRRPRPAVASSISSSATSSASASAAAVAAAADLRRSSATTASTDCRRRSSLLSAMSIVPRRGGGRHSAEKLVRKRRWKDLRDLLETDEGRRQVLLLEEEEEEEKGCDDDGNDGRWPPPPPPRLLHLACELGAPLEIVRALHEISPRSIRERDENGRTALHCAVAAAAAAPDSDREGGTAPSVACVSFLLYHTHEDGPARSASLVDNGGRTALHLACGADRLMDCNDPDAETGAGGDADACGDWIEDVKSELLLQPPTSLDPPAAAAIIDALVCACPSGISSEDDLGLTPLEYAISSGLPLSVVESMRKTSEKTWKKGKGRDRREALRRMKDANKKNGGSNNSSGSRRWMGSSSRSRRALKEFLIKASSTRRVKKGARAA